MDISIVSENGRGRLEVYGKKYPICHSVVTDDRLRRFTIAPDWENSKGERIEIEFMIRPWEENDRIWNRWANGGRIKKTKTLLFVNTFAIARDGTQHGGYDPQSKWDDEKKRYVIDFDWIKESSEESYQALIDEIYRRFMEG